MQKRGKPQSKLIAINTGQELLKATFEQDDRRRNSPGSKIKDTLKEYTKSDSNNIENAQKIISIP